MVRLRVVADVLFLNHYRLFADALREIGDGKLFPTGWLKVLKVLKWHKTDTVDFIISLKKMPRQ